jgi:hypothetical protein
MCILRSSNEETRGKRPHTLFKVEFSCDNILLIEPDIAHFIFSSVIPLYIHISLKLSPGQDIYSYEVNETISTVGLRKVSHLNRIACDWVQIPTPRSVTKERIENHVKPQSTQPFGAPTYTATKHN